MTLLGRKIKGVAHSKPRKAFPRDLDQSQPQGRSTTSLGKEVRNSVMVMIFSKDE